MTARRRLSLTLASAASVYLAATAALAATIGPEMLRFVPSSAPTNVIALGVLAVVSQIGVTVLWFAREDLARRYVVLVGTIETAIGLLIAWSAPIFHGRFAPSGQELIPWWLLWGIVGPAATGLVMIVAAMIHPANVTRPTRDLTT